MGGLKPPHICYAYIKTHSSTTTNTSKQYPLPFVEVKNICFQNSLMTLNYRITSIRVLAQFTAM